MRDEQLINKKYHNLQRNKIMKNMDNFINNEISNGIILSLDNINISFEKCLEIGFSTKRIYDYLVSRYKNIEYSCMDLSQKILDKQVNFNLVKKINIDHDQWDLEKQQFNLILSLNYINLTNNFDKLLKNIYDSLINKGFFIITIPGSNYFYELKKSMILADIDIYDGIYRRFTETYQVEHILNLLKKNNFKTPLLQVDYIDLRYKDFNSLLEDVRYLGNSNAMYDRKKIFENKIYFKKVEEIYWENFSYKNKLNLKVETLLITGWKD
jgi:SAM-dependent methyltransferase